MADYFLPVRFLSLLRIQKHMPYSVQGLASLRQCERVQVAYIVAMFSEG